MIFHASFWYVTWERTDQWKHREEKICILKIPDNITYFLVMLACAKTCARCKHWQTLTYETFLNATIVM